MPMVNGFEVNSPISASELELKLHARCDRLGDWDTCTVFARTPLDRYQEDARKTESYPKATRLHDHAMGLASEAGEVCGKLKKIDRDKGGVMTDEDKKAIMLELGDVLWYVARLADDIDWTLEAVAVNNILKLKHRAEAKTISGSGDNR